MGCGGAGGNAVDEEREQEQIAQVETWSSLSSLCTFIKWRIAAVILQVAWTWSVALGSNWLLLLSGVPPVL